MKITRIDFEQASATLLDVYVRKVLRINAARGKPVPSESTEQLLRLASDEISWR